MIEPPPLDAALRGLNLSFMPTTAEHLSEAVEKAIREAQGDDAVLAVEGHARVVREYMESGEYTVPSPPAAMSPNQTREHYSAIATGCDERLHFNGGTVLNGLIAERVMNDDLSTPSRKRPASPSVTSSTSPPDATTPQTEPAARTAAEPWCSRCNRHHPRHHHILPIGTCSRPIAAARPGICLFCKQAFTYEGDDRTVIVNFQDSGWVCRDCLVEALEPTSGPQPPLAERLAQAVADEPASIRDTVSRWLVGDGSDRRYSVTNAVPGSAKTTSVAIESKLRGPRKSICMSFTVTAASELQAKGALNGGTIHQFGMRGLRRSVMARITDMKRVGLYSSSEAPAGLSLYLEPRKTQLLVYMLFPIEEEDGPRARRSLKAQLYAEFVAKLYSAAQQRCYGLVADDRAYYSMMRCFGIEPPSRIQVVHQVNHHSDASACPTKYFDLIPCQVALRARDANGGGFVFDCSAHTRTCLLGNIIAYTPYAFDINNFVYAHLNNLAQEAPDVKPFEEMSPHEWASALEDTVKQFVYRIVKYRDKGFRRHAAQQQAQLAVHPNMLLTNNKSFDMPY